jgi:DNA-binding response OmpR family regulator
LSEFEGLPTEYFDAESGAVIVNGERRHLSPLQSRVLRHLWQHRNKIVSPRAIEAAIYPPMAKRSADALNVIKVTVCMLRKLIAGTPLRIETVYGRGYLLRVIVARPFATTMPLPPRAAEAALQPPAT